MRGCNVSPTNILIRHLSSFIVKPFENKGIRQIFCRKTKMKQRERAARSPDVQTYDYLKEELGYRLADRVCDIKRKFQLVTNIGETIEICLIKS